MKTRLGATPLPHEIWRILEVTWRILRIISQILSGARHVSARVFFSLFLH
jgi:hypothetical protein